LGARTALKSATQLSPVVESLVKQADVQLYNMKEQMAVVAMRAKIEQFVIQLVDEHCNSAGVLSCGFVLSEVQHERKRLGRSIGKKRDAKDINVGAMLDHLRTQWKKCPKDIEYQTFPVDYFHHLKAVLHACNRLLHTPLASDAWKRGMGILVPFSSEVANRFKDGGSDTSSASDNELPTSLTQAREAFGRVVELCGV
jgi:hypothetical protein